MIEKVDKLLLEALKASLDNRKVNWDSELSEEEWMLFFKKADIHQILPMVFEAVCDCPAAKPFQGGLFMAVRQNVRQQVMLQIIKTESFLALYKHQHDQNVHPLVVKGIVCRNLYPKPDYRSSGDEDMLIHLDWFEDCHQAMLHIGMVVTRED